MFGIALYECTFPCSSCCIGGMGAPRPSCHQRGGAKRENLQLRGNISLSHHQEHQLVQHIPAPCKLRPGTLPKAKL